MMKETCEKCGRPKVWHDPAKEIQYCQHCEQPSIDILTEREAIFLRQFWKLHEDLTEAIELLKCWSHATGFLKGKLLVENLPERTYAFVQRLDSKKTE